MGKQELETPDVTKEDMTGLATAVAAGILGVSSDSELVQIVAIIAAAFIVVNVIWAGTIRRGKRAEHLS